MKTKKVGVITLAIALIVLGGVLLSNNFVNIDMSLFLSLFWPTAIVLMGLEIIITKFIVDRKKEEIKMKISFGSIILLIIVIVFTSVASIIINSVTFPFTIDIARLINGENPFYTYSSTYEESYDIEINNIEKLSVDNGYGDVEIREGSGDKIKINAVIEMQHNDEDYAEQISKKIIEIHEGQKNIDIKSKVDTYNRNSGIGNLSTSFYIEIPSNIEVEVTNKYGDVSVEDINQKVTIDNKHGKIKVSNIDGVLEINNSYDKIEVSSVESDVIITNKHGEIKVKEVLGDVKIENSYDEVEVEEINGNIQIINSHDEVYVFDITGNVDINNKYANVEVRNVSKNVDIRNRNGNIKLKSNSLFTAAVNLLNQYGDITIDLLDNQEGEFSAYTKYGEIYSEFDIEIKEDTSERSLDGKIGNSNITFELESRNGDITINKN